MAVSLQFSDYVYEKELDKQVSVFYNKEKECLIQPLRCISMVSSPVAPAGPYSLWQSSVNGHLYYGPIDLSAGVPGPAGPVGPAGPAGPPGPAIDYDELDINNVGNFTDANGVNPITVPLKLVRIGNTVHLYVTEFTGNLGTTNYILAPGNPIPLAWRATPPITTSALSFAAATDVGVNNYDADITGLLRVDHATGNIRIYREAPGAGAPATWGANTGWKTMHISWTSLAP